MDSPLVTPTDIFILSGQSNMSGRGGVHHRRWDGQVPPNCKPDPRILRFSAAARWETAHVPLHADIDTAKICGVCPGMPFAHTLLETERCGGAATVGLVPCAIGGTAIVEWERGARLYESMLWRARSAAADCRGALKCVLWYQGESDTEREHDAARYKERMEKLISDFRADLGMPRLPFVQVALASGSGSKKNLDMVRRAQLSIDLPNVACVDALGLRLNDDHLHLCTEAQLKLGKMLAEAYIEHFMST